MSTAYNMSEYNALQLRRSLAGEVVKSDMEKFLTILKDNQGILKKEEIVNIFAINESCSNDVAEEIFNRERDRILKTGHVIQDMQGYYRYY